MAATNFKVTSDDSQFTEEMNNAGGKLVVANFTSARCPPCQRIAPVFSGLGGKFPGALFLQVDIQQCPSAAQQNSVSATPTFIFYRNKTKLDSLAGGDPEALEARVRKHYTDADQTDTPDCGVPGHIDLLPMMNKSGCECLNQSSEHNFKHALFSGSNPAIYLESDADEQLMLSVEFTQLVKLHSFRIKAPADIGPKTVRLFINQPYAMDFDSAMNNIAAQEITLTGKDLKGALIKLKFVKFQNVQNLTLFVQDNQNGDEVTRVNYIQIIGSPMQTTNMADFKRIAGKKGESH
uniref:Thioredoxin-like protein 1 n=2 Tax=Hirondellea gigas TaxID=1518452 RepID=A0A6A7FZ50_9CRUS